jgi:putative ABC transport system permease protein
MSRWRLVFRSLAHYWRMQLAVAMGVAAATAVLTGALLVGDSVQGSLRRLTVERLGRIDEVLAVDHFFRQELAAELAADEGFARHYAEAVPAILLPRATVERTGAGGKGRSGGVFVVASGERFWQLGDPAARPDVLPAPGQREIVLNEPLAEEIGAKVGDEVVLRLAKVASIPSDSALGRKTNTVQNLGGLKVVAVVPARGLGRFDLRASQQVPRNAWLSLPTLQNALDQPGKVNAILVAGRSESSAPGPEASGALAEAFRPRVSDYGLAVDRVRGTYVDPRTGEERISFDYFSFTSRRMMIPPAADAAAENAFAPYLAQPVLTYLANTIARVESADGAAVAAHPGIPYSTLSAVDSVPGIGPLVDDEGRPLATLPDNAIVLNRWAAGDLGARPGDTIALTYFEPESTHGQTTERTERFVLAHVVGLAEPAEPYRGDRPARYTGPITPANDPHLTPEVPGLTDKDSLANWDAPFDFDAGRVRDEDDDYWKKHRTTPKAFVSLGTGRRLWGSRFGQTTSYRVPAREGVTAEQLAGAFLGQLRRDGESLGMEFLPVKRRGLEAASGTTPFSVLFLGFSFFIIASAVMLVALLFRLGIERRASEVGTLLAVGISRKVAGRLLALEGGIVAAVGGLLGAAGGVLYAWLMLAGLRTWWVEAIVAPFLELHVSPLSLVIGLASGVVISLITILLSIRHMRGVPVRGLMSGQASAAPSGGRLRGGWAAAIAAILLAAAVGLAIFAMQLGGEAQAGAFFGSGASVLAAALVYAWHRMRGGSRGGVAAAARFGILRLAIRNAGRNPLRSTLTMGLVAAASFLIVAISAFRLAPSERGTGGFDLIAESDLPIHEDLNSPEGRRRRGFIGPSADLLQRSRVYGFRVLAGDDASCLNLYRPTQPRVLGATPAFIEAFQPAADGSDASPSRFGWGATAARSDATRHNPWLLLNEAAEDETGVPVVIDKNTAMYSLRLYGGVGQTFEVEFEGERRVRFRVVGLLDNSVLQGNLLIGEEPFKRLFPEAGGYRFFLVRSPPGKTADVRNLLEDRLGDEGFDAVSAVATLVSLLAVQNTYLSTFQSLGALGLVLGTFGLATVQFRNVLERRGELALMRAAGFRRRRLAILVLVENVLLLVGGLGVGVAAALVAVLPHAAAGGATPPWSELAVMLAIVLAAGFASGLVSVRAMLRAPILAALRGS